MENNQAVDSLIQALGDPREGLRQFATRRLVSMGDVAVAPLIEALKDQQELKQESVAIALATMGPVAVPFLLEAMKSPDRHIRWGATWVLAAMGPEVRQLIPEIRLASKPGSAVRQNVRPSGSGLHGVWSDSWLTKVRERLASIRMLDSVNLATIVEAPAEPA